MSGHPAASFAHGHRTIGRPRWQGFPRFVVPAHRWVGKRLHRQTHRRWFMWLVLIPAPLFVALGSGQRANSPRCETLQPRLNVHGDGTRDNRTWCRRARVPLKASDQERDSEHGGEDVPRSLPHGSSLTHRQFPLYPPSAVRKASAPHGHVSSNGTDGVTGSRPASP